MPTEKLNLPTITGNLAIDVQKDLNALAQAVDEKAGATNGLATLNQNGKVPSTQLDISAPPDATTTTKGIVKLNDSTDSTSITEAATANAVRKVAEAGALHSADDTSHIRYGTAAGVNAKTITLNPAPTSLTEGIALSFKSSTANTGASTLNVNALGAKPILKSNGSAVAAGNLRAGSIYTVRYDGTSFILQGEGGSGNLKPNQALAGYTFTNDEGDQIGVGDPNLVPQNILKGKNIFGVEGSLELVTPGDQYIYKLISSKSTTSTIPVVLKNVSVSKGGTYRVFFDLSSGGYAAIVQAQLYVNGVAVGIPRSTSNDGIDVNFIEDITLKNNDVIQVYGRTTSGRAATVRQLHLGIDVGSFSAT